MTLAVFGAVLLRWTGRAVDGMDEVPRYLFVWVVTHGAGIVLFLSFIKTSFVLVPNSQLQISAGLGLPLGYVYAAMPVGAALILLPMAWRFVGALRELWQRPS